MIVSAMICTCPRLYGHPILSDIQEEKTAENWRSFQLYKLTWSNAVVDRCFADLLLKDLSQISAKEIKGMLDRQDEMKFGSLKLHLSREFRKGPLGIFLSEMIFLHLSKKEFILNKKQKKTASKSLLPFLRCVICCRWPYIEFECRTCIWLPVSQAGRAKGPLFCLTVHFFLSTIQKLSFLQICRRQLWGDMKAMGLVRITSWYPNFNGSHFGLPPS